MKENVKNIIFWDVMCSLVEAYFHQTTPHHIPKDSILYSHYHENLKSQSKRMYLTHGNTHISVTLPKSAKELKRLCKVQLGHKSCVP
jgi:hypothetical protein